MSEAHRVISDKTAISLALFATLSAALVMVGIYIQKVDTLVGQMKVVQADLIAIRVRLGIPPGREATADLMEGLGITPSSPGAIGLLPSRRQSSPWQAVAVPE